MSLTNVSTRKALVTLIFDCSFLKLNILLDACHSWTQCFLTPQIIQRLSLYDSFAAKCDDFPN